MSELLSVLMVVALMVLLFSGYPVALVLIGEHGTAKTTLVRMLRSLIDPATVPTSALPFSGRDLFIAAHNSHVQAFENVSKLTSTMSDYVCRLATGGGVRARALFKDVDETLLRATRPVMLEGISNFISRADLMDRAIILALKPLTERRVGVVPCSLRGTRLVTSRGRSNVRPNRHSTRTRESEHAARVMETS